MHAPASIAPPPPTPARLRQIRDQLLDGLVERDVAVRLALLSALAGEHLLLIGPPGTAKSLVARRLRGAFESDTFFERLLTRFSVPEELFGPLSIKQLEEDRYERLTTGYLPQASVAFLDEIFKANSAILNSLLTLLNERRFDNGTRRERAPLVSVVGASNELPEGEELSALFDRFLVRLHVGPVSDEGFDALLLLGDGGGDVQEELRLTDAELRAVRLAANSVEVPGEVLGMLSELRRTLQVRQIPVSDRRWRKVVHLLRVAAVTNGRTQVSVWDCWLLQHCTWDEPDQRQAVYDWYAGKVGTTGEWKPEVLDLAVGDWEERLEQDRTDKEQARNAKGRLVYQRPDGKRTTTARGRLRATNERGEELYLAPAGALSTRQAPLDSRDNDGKGYTKEQLWKLQIPQDYRIGPLRNWRGLEAYLTDDANRLWFDGDFTLVWEPKRHAAAYISDCQAQLDDLLKEIHAYGARLEEHRSELETSLRNHLWVTDDFVQPATAALRRVGTEVDRIAARVEAARKGFGTLPTRPTATPARSS